MKNIPLYVRFGHNFRLERISEEKERNGYVDYQHICADEICGLNMPDLDILGCSGSAGTKLLSCMGAQCAVSEESGNRVIPTKLEYRTYLFLRTYSASESGILRGLNPPSLELSGPVNEFLANIRHSERAQVSHVGIGIMHTLGRFSRQTDEKHTFEIYLTRTRLNGNLRRVSQKWTRMVEVKQI